MADALDRMCNRTGCGNFALAGKSYCALHQAERWKNERQRRGGTASRGYDTSGHRARRLLVLHRDILCRICNVALSTICDHIIPPAEGGSRTAMSNLQGLCKTCHDKKSGQEGIRRMRERLGKKG